MRLRRRQAPLAILLLACGLLSGVTLAEQVLHRRLLRTAAAAAEYRLAVAETRAALLGRMALLNGDATLMQNLNWKLTHSVASSLAGKMQEGALEQVVLFSAACQEVGRAAVAPSVPISCPTGEGKKARYSDVYWLQHDGRAVMALQRELNGVETHGDVTAVGIVALGEPWLMQRPQLKEQIDRLGLRLGDSGGVALVAPEVIGESPAAVAPTLRSDLWIDRLLRLRGVQLWFFDASLVWPCLLLMIGCALLALWRDRAEHFGADAGLAAFHLWCQHLMQGTPAPTSAQSGQCAATALNLGLPEAKQFITRALQVKSEALAEQHRQRQSLEEQIKGKDAELQTLRGRLVQLAELDSLTIQLQRTAAVFLEHMDQLHSHADDLRQLIAESFVAESRALQQLSRSWQEGLRERGARKFIRSLAETRDANDHGSELDAALAQLSSHCEQLQDLSINATRMTSLLESEATGAAHIAGLWHALAARSQDLPPCPSLAVAVEQAQALVQLAPQLAHVHFTNGLAKHALHPLPAVPTALWTSALYHIFLTMAETAKDATVQIDSRLRADGKKILFIIQITGDQAPTLPQRSDQQAYHIGIAKAILAPYQVGLSVLPAVCGPYPIIVSWHSDRLSKRPAPSPTKERAKAALASP